MTMVIHRQMDGMVQVGADRITNPYRGDTNCDQRLPVLCTFVGGVSPATKQQRQQLCRRLVWGRVSPILPNEWSRHQHA